MTEELTIIVMTKNRCQLLWNSLASIRRQGFEGPLIVADDHSSDQTKQVAAEWDSLVIQPKRPYRYGQKPHGIVNPGATFNAGLEAVKTPKVIIQSDDIIHQRQDTILRLGVVPEQICFVARIIGTSKGEEIIGDHRRSLRFSLASIHAKHLALVGGCDPEFLYFGHEDAWLEQCLLHDQRVTPIFRPDIIGVHQDHPRLHDWKDGLVTKEILDLKVRKAKTGEIPWISSAGRWKWPL